MIATPVDSRHYRFPYEINALSDAPDDFGLTGADEDIVGGLFLPLDEPAWFGRATPPRVLLLGALRLTMFSHPQTTAPPVVAPVASISTIESGHALLIGWIHIHHGDATLTLPYNTRSSRPVDRFLQRLRSSVFPPGGAGSGVEQKFGPELDIKFRNARHSQINEGEFIRASFFQPPAELPRRFGWLSFRRWACGDFVALTDRRILWISDRIRGGYDRYGLIARYGRPAALSALAFDAEARAIVFSFRSGQTWHISIRAEWSDAAWFFAELCRAKLVATGHM